MFIDIDGGAPKRGDLVYTNVGNRRERTWLILAARRMRKSKRANRFKVWMARWWELEPDMRMRLYRSAQRAGGQRAINLKRYPAKKKRAWNLQRG